MFLMFLILFIIIKYYNIKNLRKRKRIEISLALPTRGEIAAQE